MCCRTWWVLFVILLAVCRSAFQLHRGRLEASKSCGLELAVSAENRPAPSPRSQLRSRHGSSSTRSQLPSRRVQAAQLFRLRRQYMGQLRHGCAHRVSLFMACPTRVVIWLSTSRVQICLPAQAPVSCILGDPGNFGCFYFIAISEGILCRGFTVLGSGSSMHWRLPTVFHDLAKLVWNL